MSNSTNRVGQKLYQEIANPRLVELLRAPLMAIALFCAIASIAPQAVAQACGNSFNLRADRWTMVGIPCVPPADKATIENVFGPSLGADNYGITWVIWKRVYDDSRCNVSSGPSDCYIKLTLGSAATTGDAFWIYTTVETSLQFSSTTTSTPGTEFDFENVKLSTDGNSRYYMFTNPWGSIQRWRFVLFPAVVSGNQQTLSVEEAIALNIVSKDVHFWNGNTYFTRDLENRRPRARFRPKQGVWLEMRQPDASVDPSTVKIRVPKP